MKFIKKILVLLPMLLVNIMPNMSHAVGNTNDIIFYLPDTTWQEDVNIESTQIQPNESTIFEYIRIINDYLWFGIAGIAMFVLMFAGLKFIINGGKDAKKAGILALSCLIAITVAMLSYLLVNLIVGLF